MKLSSYEAGDALVLVVEGGRIDAAAAPEFKAAAKAAVAGVTGRVVLDLSAVGFIDSTGLGAVIGLHKQLDGKGRLEVAGLTRPVEKVFALTRMNSIFTIHDSAPAAS